MSTTINITLDTKNIYMVQAFISAMGGVLMNMPYDHTIQITDGTSDDALNDADNSALV